MDELKRSRTHFIRCLKPNDKLVPNAPDAMLLLDQVRNLPKSPPTLPTLPKACPHLAPSTTFSHHLSRVSPPPPRAAPLLRHA